MSPELQALLNLVTGGGPYALAAVFAFLWWDARTDLKEQHRMAPLLLERVLTALNGNTNALGDLRVYLGLNRTDQGGK